jgi:plasmid stabilization system protein ParE
MAKQIIWTSNAIQDQLQILEYWSSVIGNNNYSKYLNKSFNETINTISQFPEIGRIYKDMQLRYMVKENYLIFYNYNEINVFILGIFDSRRNPKLLNKKYK